MNMQIDRARAVMLGVTLLAALGTAPAAMADSMAELGAIAWGDHRPEGSRERNRYRHPVETLTFFGIEPGMTVVEVSPGGGWYTEILAPFLRGSGRYYAAAYDPGSDSEYRQRSARRFLEKLAAQPEVYDAVEVSVFEPPAKVEIAPAGTADLVVTFRNVHGWLQGDTARVAFEAMHEALKPGGVLGVVQHRGEPGNPAHRTGEAGYLDENYLIGFIEAVGFQLVETSEVNANPADMHDHPEGVWTLPPTLRLGDVDRADYLRIGESDRMTLKFVKR